jgi:ribosomal protein S18 acetylase RimI-like enzyme
MNEQDSRAIREIFFLSSSRQTFASDDEREKFFSLWTDYYFKHAPELIFLDRDEKGRVRGYLMGAADSSKASTFYKDSLKSYAVFSDLFARFPAHLHINVHPSGRSQGVGARLIETFVAELRQRGIAGVHIVTSPDSANRAFYLRNGFTFEEIRKFRGTPLLFMGRQV